jgi:dihydrofolate reductase
MVVCYVAQSLDGFIADEDGGLDWLPTPKPGNDYEYHSFYQSVDAVLLGRKTYEQSLTFDVWPHADKPVRVFTHKLSTNVDKLPPNVSWVTQRPKDVVSDLYSKDCKRLWLVGGSELIASFRQDNLIDEYIITTIPVLLGNGIPLFQETLGKREFLCCTRSKRFADGVVQSSFMRVD